MDGELPYMLNLLATEAACPYPRAALAYMRFVISESSPEEREALRACLVGMKYERFLKTAYWQIVRANVLGVHPMCHRCRVSQASHVHHRNYRIHGMEHDNTDSLVGLCGKCHQREHELIPQIAQEARHIQATLQSRGSNQGSLSHITDFVQDVQRLIDGDPA